jgi:hypothetical protein
MQFTLGIPQFPQFTCRHHDGIISERTQPSKMIKREVALCIHWSIQIVTWTLGHRKQALLRFWLWPKVTIPHSHGQEDSQKRQKTDKRDGKPVLCQRTLFSFLCSSFYTVKLHGLTVSVWAPHLFLSKFLFLSFSHGSWTEKEVQYCNDIQQV